MRDAALEVERQTLIRQTKCRSYDGLYSKSPSQGSSKRGSFSSGSSVNRGSGGDKRGASGSRFQRGGHTQGAGFQSVSSGYHTPIPGPTRLADPNRFRGARPYTGTLYLIFFSKSYVYLWVWPTSYNIIKIYTHLPVPFTNTTVLLQLQIRARNLHVVNPYKCVGPVVCGCLLTSSPVPTRIKTRAKLYA